MLLALSARVTETRMARRIGKGWIAAALLVCAPSLAGASTIRVDYHVLVAIQFAGSPIGPAGPHGQGTISLLYAAPPSLPTGASGPSLPVLAGPAALSGGRLQAGFTQLFSHLPSSMAVGGIRVR